MHKTGFYPETNLQSAFDSPVVHMLVRLPVECTDPMLSKKEQSIELQVTNVMLPSWPHAHYHPCWVMHAGLQGDTWQGKGMGQGANLHHSQLHSRRWPGKDIPAADIRYTCSRLCIYLLYMHTSAAHAYVCRDIEQCMGFILYMPAMQRIYSGSIQRASCCAIHCQMSYSCMEQLHGTAGVCDLSDSLSVACRLVGTCPPFPLPARDLSSLLLDCPSVAWAISTLLLRPVFDPSFD